VNSPRTLPADPQFPDRFTVFPHTEHGADMLSSPLRFTDVELPAPAKAPEAGEHTDEVLRDLLGYDDARIAALRASGALGTG
jgi:crotonobetainyl-CoA:carnitine CoA-transferase CaiB-like acyl-CoA transferase